MPFATRCQTTPNGFQSHQAARGRAKPPRRCAPSCAKTRRTHDRLKRCGFPQETLLFFRQRARGQVSSLFNNMGGPNLRATSWILHTKKLVNIEKFVFPYLEGRFSKIWIFKIHSARYTTATTTPTPTHKHRTRLGANPRLEARRAARRATAHLPCAIEALRAI